MRAEKRSGDTAQTLDRGLAMLAILADSDKPLTPTELAVELGVSRPIVYRLLNTLLARRLVKQSSSGGYVLGTGVLDLTRRVVPDLQRAAEPELHDLADEFNATSILVMADGDEAVCVNTVEPPGPHLRLRYPPGFRNPLTLTASGMAILSTRPETAGEREEIGLARRRGYAMSFGDIQTSPGVAVAAPIVVDAAPAEASIAVATLDHSLDEDRAAARVLAAASRIGAELR